MQQRGMCKVERGLRRRKPIPSRGSAPEEVHFEWNLEGQVVVCQVGRSGKGRLGRESCVSVQV